MSYINLKQKEPALRYYKLAFEMNQSDLTSKDKLRNLITLIEDIDRIK
jgi:hypothetical protein